MCVSRTPRCGSIADYFLHPCLSCARFYMRAGDARQAAANANAEAGSGGGGVGSAMRLVRHSLNGGKFWIAVLDHGAGGRHETV